MSKHQKESENGKGTVVHLISANNSDAKRAAGKPGDEVAIDLSNYKRGAHVRGRITKVVTEKL